MAEAVAHFHGGPRDGVEMAVPDASLELRLAELREVRYAGEGEVEEVCARTLVYRRRRGAAGGHVHYDWVPDVPPHIVKARALAITLASTGVPISPAMHRKLGEILSAYPDPEFKEQMVAAAAARDERLKQYGATMAQVIDAIYDA